MITYNTDFTIMSRQFNTKIFIMDVLNDKYAHHRTAIQSVVEVSWSSFGAAKELAGSSYTTLLFEYALEAGKKEPRRSLEYGYKYVEGAPLPLLWCSFSVPLVSL